MESFMTEEHTIPQELGADGRPTDIEKEIEVPYPFDAEKISISNKPGELKRVVSQPGTTLDLFSTRKIRYE
jgi:hypothetical protein